MLPRVIAMMAIAAAQVVSRAFMQAYQEAARNPNKTANAAKSASKAMKKVGGMSIEEARKVLNVTKESSVDEVMTRYKHLFAVNDKSKGGSFYIQSKVFRAREALEDEDPDAFAKFMKANPEEAKPEEDKPKSDSKKD